jgi:hypothetical protein
MPEATVNLEVLAATSGIGYDTLQRRFASGKIPAPDFREKRRLGWRLSTIRSWNPQVAARIERGLTDEIFAFRPAA